MEQVAALLQWWHNSLNVLWRSIKRGFIVKKENLNLLILVFVCVVCEGLGLGLEQSELNQIIRESMLHMVGQDQYVEGVLQGVIGVEPVCSGLG